MRTIPVQKFTHNKFGLITLAAVSAAGILYSTMNSKTPKTDFETLKTTNNSYNIYDVPKRPIWTSESDTYCYGSSGYEDSFVKSTETENDTISYSGMTNMNIANNLTNAVTDPKNSSKLIEQAITSLNEDSVYDIACIYYSMNKQNRLFESIAKYGIYYNPDTTSANVIANKLMEGYEGLLKYAKENKIYTKDFEKIFKEYRKKRRYPELAREMDNLFKRIYVSQNTLSDTPLNKRRLNMTNPNGTIDGTFAQGDADDCWLLAAIIASLNDSAAKYKINNMSKIYKSTDIDSINISLNDGSYTFEYDELKGAVEYSSGDPDSRAIEIAVNKLMQENFSSLNHGSPDLAKGFKYLFGEDNVDIEHYSINSDYIDKLRTENKISVIGSKRNAKQYYLLDEDDNKVPAISGHAYAAKGADDTYIYVIDPGNSSRKLKCHIGDAEKIFNDAVIANLKESV